MSYQYSQTEKDRSSSQKKSSFESSKSETPPDVAILSISELKKLCVLRFPPPLLMSLIAVRNISIEHCVEKSELINLLYKSYGVDHTTPSSTKESNDSKRPSSASHHNQEKSTLKRPPSSSGGIRPPPSSGTTMSGNKMHNLWSKFPL